MALLQRPECVYLSRVEGKRSRVEGKKSRVPKKSRVKCRGSSKKSRVKGKRVQKKPVSQVFKVFKYVYFTCFANLL